MIITLHHQCRNRLGNDFYIEQKTHLLRILDVQIDHLVECSAVFPTYLPQTSEARHCIRTPFLPCLIHFKFVRNTRARSDQAHLPFDHVDQLRKFIKPGCTDNFPERNDARIISRIKFCHRCLAFDQLSGMTTMRIDFSAKVHRAKFVTGEQRTFVADALLTEHHRAARSQFDH